MKRFYLGLVVLLIFSNVLNAQTTKIDTLLFELPDVIFSEIETANDFKATYRLSIKQPLDHSDLSKGYYYQKAYLSHKGFDRPTVMVTAGYSVARNYSSELTEFINANQILIEHRYFGESMPDSLDYKNLNLKQVTADLHRINTLFRAIYKEKWLSTGVSKGGATTLFYRYLYPNDVDVSVNYVGPINNAFEDKRIYKFLDTVGTKSCRDKIYQFQKYLLKNKEELLPILENYSSKANVKYTYHSIEKAFEYAVMEYPFSFWQYGSDCENIPEPNVTSLEALEYFTSVSDISFFSDSGVAQYTSHYYQSATEFGYYGYETEEFDGLLTELSTKQNPHATFLPKNTEASFDDELLNGINNWLPKEGNKIIHIYGTLDTWSASAVPKSKNVDALWFFLKDKHHGNARIKSMTNSQKQKLITALERWLSIRIE